MSHPLRSEKGQATVEVALLLPLILMPLLFGLVEFGFIFSSQITIAAATREGARMGSNLANGGGPLGCSPSPPNSPNWAAVDQQIIASVERSLTGAGSEITLANITGITIYKAATSGGIVSGSPAPSNTWTYSWNNGPTIDGDNLDFVAPGTDNWRACSRVNTAGTGDAMGVKVVYTYQPKSPLRYFLPAVATWTMSDATVMVLNATQ
jgi:hypothetical protein